jgi:GNAT superfamily N-acetyltransferase
MIRVQRATTVDLPEIAALHVASISELCAAHYTSEQLTHWTAGLHAAAYAALLTSRAMFVAREASSLLGFGVVDAERGFIHATYVGPTAVRRGVGRSLMEAMEELALRFGCSELQLHATLNAIAFYERLGYRQVGAANNRLPNGSELPCALMCKPAGP